MQVSSSRTTSRLPRSRVPSSKVACLRVSAERTRRWRHGRPKRVPFVDSRFRSGNARRSHTTTRVSDVPRSRSRARGSSTRELMYRTRVFRSLNRRPAFVSVPSSTRGHRFLAMCRRLSTTSPLRFRTHPSRRWRRFWRQYYHFRRLLRLVHPLRPPHWYESAVMVDFANQRTVIVAQNPVSACFQFRRKCMMIKGFVEITIFSIDLVCDRIGRICLDNGVRCLGMILQKLDGILTRNRHSIEIHGNALDG